MNSASIRIAKFLFAKRRHHSSTSVVRRIAKERREGWSRPYAAAAAGTAGLVVLISYAPIDDANRNHEGASSAEVEIDRYYGCKKRSWQSMAPFVTPSSWLQSAVTTGAVRCDVDGRDDDDDHRNDDSSSYSEAEHFHQCLEYHRYLLGDYIRRWGDAPDDDGGAGVGGEGKATGKDLSVVEWPRNIPEQWEIASLELDAEFCKRSPTYRTNAKTCQNMQFRVAAFYLKKDDEESQKKAFKMLKDLAQHGHPDGMCLYGIILNEGKIAGVEAIPDQAVVWWRRCVDFHRHIQATYELAVAFYTGEGVAENPELALELFRRASHLGHAGAAYMLGEMLLDGVGAKRDRALALEWLVTAAELGHHLARNRVLSILKEDYEHLDSGHPEGKKKDEAFKWVSVQNETQTPVVNVERRYTIGGGSRNPKVLESRKTKVQESRDR